MIIKYWLKSFSVMKIDILSNLQYDVTGYDCYARERKLGSVS